MKTFVHHDGALGDVLLSVPCLLAIRAFCGPVHLVGRGDVVRFLKDTAIADEAMPSDRALFASLYSSPDARLRDFLSGFAIAFVFSADGHASPSNVISSIIPRTRVIKTIPPRGSSIHAAAHRLLQLEPGVAAAGRELVPSLPLAHDKTAEAVLLKAGCLARNVIGLHPGSGGRAKCWPLEQYFEFVRRIQEDRHVFVVLFTGEAEKGSVQEAVSGFARSRQNVLHAADLDLLSAAALLQRCKLYIGNDSGFSHLAGLLGCPALILFGPTDPTVWKPLGPRVQVISAKGSMTGIGVAEVISQVELHASRSLRRNSVENRGIVRVC
jgi:heptosyltransferase III